MKRPEEFPNVQGGPAGRPVGMCRPCPHEHHLEQENQKAKKKCGSSVVNPATCSMKPSIPQKNAEETCHHMERPHSGLGRCVTAHVSCNPPRAAETLE